MKEYYPWLKDLLDEVDQESDEILTIATPAEIRYSDFARTKIKMAAVIAALETFNTWESPPPDEDVRKRIELLGAINEDLDQKWQTKYS